MTSEVTGHMVKALQIRKYLSADCLFESSPKPYYCTGNLSRTPVQYPSTILKLNAMSIAWELVTPQVIGRNVFVIISTPVYILFLVVIIRFRKKAPFNSAFFRLSIVTAIIDLFSIVHSQFIYEYATLGITTKLLRPLLLYDARMRCR